MPISPSVYAAQQANRQKLQNSFQALQDQSAQTRALSAQNDAVLKQLSAVQQFPVGGAGAYKSVFSSPSYSEAYKKAVLAKPQIKAASTSSNSKKGIGASLKGMLGSAFQTLQGVDGIVTNQIYNWADGKAKVNDIPLYDFFKYTSRGVKNAYKDVAKDGFQASDILSYANLTSGKALFKGLQEAGKQQKTTKDIFEMTGWNPTSRFGKIVKGTTEFVGDVALAPSTYVPILGEAGVVGKLGIKAMSKQGVEELVKKGVSKKAAESIVKKGVSSSAVKKQVVKDLASQIKAATPELSLSQAKKQAKKQFNNNIEEFLGTKITGNIAKSGVKIGAEAEAKILNAGKKARFEGQNFVAGFNIPFTNKAWAFGDSSKIPIINKIFAKADYKIGSLGATAIRKLAEDAGIAANDLEQIVKARYGVDNIEDITSQGFDDFTNIAEQIRKNPDYASAVENAKAAPTPGSGDTSMFDGASQAAGAATSAANASNNIVNPGESNIIRSTSGANGASVANSTLGRKAQQSISGQREYVKASVAKLQAATTKEEQQAALKALSDSAKRMAEKAAKAVNPANKEALQAASDEFAQMAELLSKSAKELPSKKDIVSDIAKTNNVVEDVVKPATTRGRKATQAAAPVEEAAVKATTEAANTATKAPRFSQQQTSLIKSSRNKLKEVDALEQAGEAVDAAAKKALAKQLDTTIRKLTNTVNNQFLSKAKLPELQAALERALSAKEKLDKLDAVDNNALRKAEVAAKQKANPGRTLQRTAYRNEQIKKAMENIDNVSDKAGLTAIKKTVQRQFKALEKQLQNIKESAVKNGKNYKDSPQYQEVLASLQEAKQAKALIQSKLDALKNTAASAPDIIDEIGTTIGNNAPVVAKTTEEIRTTLQDFVKNNVNLSGGYQELVTKVNVNQLDNIIKQGTDALSSLGFRELKIDRTLNKAEKISMAAKMHDVAMQITGITKLLDKYGIKDFKMDDLSVTFRKDAFLTDADIAKTSDLSAMGVYKPGAKPAIILSQSGKFTFAHEFAHYLADKKLVNKNVVNEIADEIKSTKAFKDALSALKDEDKIKYFSDNEEVFSRFFESALYNLNVKGSRSLPESFISASKAHTQGSDFVAKLTEAKTKELFNKLVDGINGKASSAVADNVPKIRKALGSPTSGAIKGLKDVIDAQPEDVRKALKNPFETLNDEIDILEEGVADGSIKAEDLDYFYENIATAVDEAESALKNFTFNSKTKSKIVNGFNDIYAKVADILGKSDQEKYALSPDKATRAEFKALNSQAAEYAMKLIDGSYKLDPKQHGQEMYQAVLDHMGDLLKRFETKLSTKITKRDAEGFIKAFIPAFKWNSQSVTKDIYLGYVKAIKDRMIQVQKELNSIQFPKATKAANKADDILTKLDEVIKPEVTDSVPGQTIADNAPRGRGRPKGSKNKPKAPVVKDATTIPDGSVLVGKELVKADKINSIIKSAFNGAQAFQQDMGGQSVVGKFFANTVFKFLNARTLGTSDSFLNQAAGDLQDSMNRGRAWLGKAHIDVGRIEAAAKGLTNEDMMMVKYVMQDAYPKGMSLQKVYEKVTDRAKFDKVVRLTRRYFSELGDNEIMGDILNQEFKNPNYFFQLKKNTLSPEEIEKMVRAAGGKGYSLKLDTGTRRVAFESFAEWKDKLDELSANLKNLAGEELSVAKENLEKLRNLYEEDFFKTLKTRAEGMVRKTSTAQLYQTYLKKGLMVTSDQLDRLENAKDFVPANDLGIGKFKGKYYIHKDIMTAMTEAENIFTSKTMQTVVDFVTSITNIGKTFSTTLIPKHHVNNLTGNVMLNAMKGVSDKAYSKAIEVLYKYARNQDMSEAEIKLLNQAFDDGIMRTGHLLDSSDPVRVALSKARNGKVVGSVIAAEKKIAENKYALFMRGIGDWGDDVTRLAHYLHIRSVTGSRKLAQESVRKTLYNYSEKTALEKNFLGLAFPFYSWLKNNSVAMLGNFIKQPGFFMNLERARQQINSEEKNPQLIPDYMSSSFRISDGKYVNFQLPQDELRRLDFASMMNSINPLAKTPFEVYFNKQIFNGAKIDKYKTDNTSYDAKALAKYFLGQTSSGYTLSKAFDTTDKKTGTDVAAGVFIPWYTQVDYAAQQRRVSYQRKQDLQAARQKRIAESLQK